jgi:hypothetical protein
MDEATEPRIEQNGEIERVLEEAVRNTVAAVAVVVLDESGELTFGFKLAGNRSADDTLQYLACGAEMLTANLAGRLSVAMLSTSRARH